MNIAPEQAQLIAIERAKVAIIEEHFGTVVGVNNFTTIKNDGTDSSVNFLSLGESEVKGEWIETIGKPEITHEFANNMQVITVSITGKIRETTSAKALFQADVLRNGFDDRFKSDEFHNGDDLYLSFKSPTDGYVVIYLYDLTGVSRLLPLKYDSNQAFQVKGGVHYVFFADGVSEYSTIENKNPRLVNCEYSLTCSGESEVNRIYVVFSPHPFTKANDRIYDDISTPANLDFDEFQRWLAKNRRQDKDMTLKIRDITIRN
ncbi:MAG: DUF4384 domain-containing protein [Bacteroidales bacterium]|nr:DUF4384 domain-containing protein [Candidatus Cryptobacteroides aphodequi]